mmetsp:Transcript_11316/g.37669  ORF Transcript_11316/g.37669 Transcript_11316/m.37669 type:complete len:639 (-) Transcript_11316:128-2044(-)
MSAACLVDSAPAPTPAAEADGRSSTPRVPATASQAPAAAPTRKRKPPATCWGQELSGTSQCAPVEASSAAFHQRFCAVCRKRGVVLPAYRIREVVEVAGSAPVTNEHASGAWNLQRRTSRWPAHRVVNQTVDSTGPKLVILREEIADELPGLVPLQCPPEHEVVFRVGRTLQPQAPLWETSPVPNTSSGSSSPTEPKAHSRGKTPQSTVAPPAPWSECMRASWQVTAVPIGGESTSVSTVDVTSWTGAIAYAGASASESSSSGSSGGGGGGSSSSNNNNSSSSGSSIAGEEDEDFVDKLFTSEQVEQFFSPPASPPDLQPQRAAPLREGGKPWHRVAAALTVGHLRLLVSIVLSSVRQHALSGYAPRGSPRGPAMPLFRAAEQPDVLWVQMRYADPSIEAELRSRTHRDAYWLQQAALGLFLLHHLLAPLFKRSLFQVSMCWTPSILIQLVSRYHLQKIDDPALGYRLGSQRLVGLLIMGCAAQWLFLFTGSFEPVQQALAIFYFSHFFMCQIIFHIMHMDVRLRAISHVAIVATFSTLGWGGRLSGPVSFSELGQPFDAGVVLLFNGLGAIVGTFMELIVRRGYLATHREQKRAAALEAKLERTKASMVVRPPPAPPPTTLCGHRWGPLARRGTPRR